MSSFVQPGKLLRVAMPYDRASAGLGVLVGSIFGITQDAALNTVEGMIDTEGVHNIAKTSAQAWTRGQKVYWDDTNKRCDTTGTVGPLIGVASEIAANPSATGTVKLKTAPAPRAATAVAALTDNSGGAAADGTIAAVVDVATAANAVKELATKQNELITKLQAAGILP